jgi:hypothetical protein
MVTHARARRQDLVALIHKRWGSAMAQACNVIVVSSVADAERGLRDEGRPVVFDRTFYLHASIAAIAMAEKLASGRRQGATRDASPPVWKRRLRAAVTPHGLSPMIRAFGAGEGDPDPAWVVAHLLSAEQLRLACAGDPPCRLTRGVWFGQ